MVITDYRIKCGIHRRMTAALVADLHDREYGDVLGALRERGPDMILIPGDIVDRHGNTAERGFASLAAFASVAPTFMSLGNHEAHAVPETRRAAVAGGVTLLENRDVIFEGIRIGGLTSAFAVGALPQGIHRKTPKPDLRWLEKFAAQPGFKLLLSHHPEYYPAYIRKLDIDIIVSGHAHGGQWRLFGHGVFAPGQGWFPGYSEGVHDGRLIVSRGLANNAPVPRFFNPRELVFISLEPHK